MLNIKKDSDISLEIYEAAAKNRRDSRGYLGMSEIGKPCDLAIWFSWRKFTPAPWDGRILILFELGDHVEQVIIRNLRLAGYELQNAYPDKQLSFEDCGGFFSGHCDGLVRLRTLEGSPWGILECKSANKNKIEDFERHGVEKSNPTYFTQMQCYMGYRGLNHALLMVMNKNDSAIYSEIVRFSPEAFAAAKEKAAKILTTHNDDGTQNVPAKGFDDPKCLECKWCSYRLHCWEPKEAIQTTSSCRNCHYFALTPPSFKPACRHQAHPVELSNISLCCPEWSFIGKTPF